MAIAGHQWFTMRLLLCSLLLAALPALALPTLTDPYVRALPPGAPNTAAFLSLTNDGSADLALVAVETTVAKRAELHTHQMVDGMAQMRQVEKIALPVGQTVVLAPGGLHIMLFDLTRELKEGDKVELTLIYSDGSRQPVVADVRPVMAHSHHQQ